MKRQAVRDRDVAVRGLCYILQHCTQDLSTRQDQATALAQHLKEHTYYRSSHEETHDAVTFRLLLGDFAREANLSGTRFKDTVDVICELRLSGVPDELLEIYDYDKATFTIEDLPPFEPAVESESSVGVLQQAKGITDSYIQRALWIGLSDINAVKSMSNHADYKYRSKEHILLSLDLLIEQYKMTTWPDSDGPPGRLDVNRLYTSLLTAYSHRVAKPSRPGTKKHRSRSNLWNTGTGGSKAQNSNKSYWYVLESSAKFRQDQDKTDAYGETPWPTATLFSEVQDGRQRLNLPYHDADATASAIAEDVAARAQKKGKSKAQVLRSLRATRDESTESEIVVDGPTYPPMRSEAASSSTRESSLGRNDASFPPPDYEAAPPSLRAASSHRASHTTRASLRARTSSAHTSVAAKPGFVRLSGDPLDFDEVAKAMQYLQRHTKARVEKLFTTLGLPVSLDSPFHFMAGPELQTLYQLCWGSQWQQTVTLGRKLRFAAAFDVMLGLLAAYLHHYALYDSAPSSPWQDFLMESLGFQLQSRYKTLSHDDATQLLQGSPPMYADTVSQLQKSGNFYRYAQKHASSLAIGFCTIIKPHLDRVSTIAKAMDSMDVDTHCNQDSWSAPLLADVEDLMYQALHLKAKLVDTSLSSENGGYQHTFFWPEHGAPVDGLSMNARNGRLAPEKFQVAFTFFPGIRTQFDGEEAHVVGQAEIIAQPRP